MRCCFDIADFTIRAIPEYTALHILITTNTPPAASVFLIYQSQVWKKKNLLYIVIVHDSAHNNVLKKV